ncbi:MAG: hypothetical protein QF393_13610 [Rhodospirillales bacterium]|jgi:hypothetical protein|nr:hypothetical protein [Rhodospirillaceae bacterium]MDP6429047.1 hypothetical protein [Rhodospirillales bacterium]MDP6644249.1 hypothetical protein [Rhodospirillales bacterium]|tara:strand:- start:293 stop:709 length:417 start_codon:yes stop_codon:yes gene_type:complete
MNWTLHIDPEVNCAFFKFFGTFRFGAMVEAMTEMLNHPDYRGGMNILRDISDQPFPSDLTYKAITEENRRVTAEIDLKIGECRFAIVVGDARSYAVVHQYIVTGRLRKNPVERKPFRDMEAAKEWLGLPADYEIKYPN